MDSVFFAAKFFSTGNINDYLQYKTAAKTRDKVSFQHFQKSSKF